MKRLSKKPSGAEQDSLRKDFDRLLEKFVPEPLKTETTVAERKPSFVISENKDRMLVRAELPGMNANDLRLSLTGNMLTLTGRKKKGPENSGEHRHHHGRSQEVFQRLFRLPAGVDPDQIKAKINHDVLSITVFKSADIRVKKVEINSR